jgi:hypothetical protein
MGTGGAGNKQADLRVPLAAQPGRGRQGLLDAQQGRLLHLFIIRLTSIQRHGIQSRILGQPRRASSVCLGRIASRAHRAWLIALLDTPNPTRQRPCCRRTILKDSLQQPATTTNHSHHLLNSRSRTVAHLAINPPPWVQLPSATTITRRPSSRNNTSNSDTVVDTVPHQVQPAVLPLLRAIPSHHPHLRPTTARDLDLLATTTVLRSLRTNAHPPSHHLRTLTLTVVRRYGLCSWPWTRSATVS